MFNRSSLSAELLQADTQRGQFGPLAQTLLIILVAGIVCLPCLVRGVPPIGDAVNHTGYQHHFSQQFWSGEFYPRWLREANKGYGSPIFLVQYPLPYWGTALLRPVLHFRPTPDREAYELAVYSFLVFAGAGVAARYWLRAHHTQFAATLGAITYISLPYFLGADLYRGVEIGQLMGFVWMPLALAICSSPRMNFVRVGALSAITALLIMSNVIAAFLFVPLLIAYGIACTDSRYISIRRRTLAMFCSLVIGSGIAGVYLLPLLAYRKLFDLSAMPRILPSFSISSNFAFVSSADLPRGLVAALICGVAASLVAMWSLWRAGGRLERVCGFFILGLAVTTVVPGVGNNLITLSGMAAPFADSTHFSDRMLATSILTFALGVFAYCQATGHAPQSRRRLIALLGSASGAFVLMLPWSTVAWRAVPILSTSIQFPSRLCEILTVATVGLLAPAVDFSFGDDHMNTQWLQSPKALSLFIVGVLALGLLIWRPDQAWRYGLRDHAAYELDPANEVDPMYRTYIPNQDLAPFSALIGTHLSSYNSDHTAVAHGSAVLLQGQGRIVIVWRDAQTFLLGYDLPSGGSVKIDQLYSPLWKVVTGGFDPMSSADGLMEIPLAAGHHEVKFEFELGWPESLGKALTMVSATFALGLILWEFWGKLFKFHVPPKHEPVEC